jgi:hypothetical protein
MAVEGAVGYMSVGVSVGYMSVGWACGRAHGRDALGERPSGEGGEWEEREREGDGMGGEGGRGMGWALGFGDYLDAGLPVAKSATNPYTTCLIPLSHCRPTPLSTDVLFRFRIVGLLHLAPMSYSAFALQAYST